MTNERTILTHRRSAAPRARRGAAMLLVLYVIAVAAILVYAMLSMASLQRQMERNIRRGPEAEALAESGVNLAIYYLLNPQNAPGYAAMTNIDWYWPGTGGPVGFGAAADGTIDVAVTHDPAKPFEYEITSTGAAAGSAVSRTVHSRVFVNADYEVNHAAVFGSEPIAVGGFTTLGALGEPTKVYARGALTIKTGGKVYGTVYKGLFSPASLVQPIGGSFQALPVVPVFVPPDLSRVRSYLTYTLPGDPTNTVYTADTHAGGLSLGGAWGPSATNPAGVHVVTGDLTLLANAHVSGTLVVTGNLSLNLLASTVSVATLQSALPALVVGGNIDF